MPTFQGQVNEEDLMRLLAYVKTLGANAGTGTTPPLAVESAQSLRTSAGAPTTTASTTTSTTTSSTTTSGQTNQR
jgi:hypothetical protein